MCRGEELVARGKKGYKGIKSGTKEYGEVHKDTVWIQGCRSKEVGIGSTCSV